MLCQVLRALVEGYASEVGSREVASLVSDLLPVLIDKAGDNNSRIRSDTMLSCAVLCCVPSLGRQAWGSLFAYSAAL